MNTLHAEKVFNELIKKSKTSSYNQINNCPKLIRRQQITKFLSRYEVFKKQVNIKGSIVENGVDEGFGAMTFAHFPSIIINSSDKKNYSTVNK